MEETTFKVRYHISGVLILNPFTATKAAMRLKIKLVLCMPVIQFYWDTFSKNILEILV